MNRVRTILFGALLCLGPLTGPAWANDFYTSMLQRGVSSALRGDHERALKELRIAAFGFIDDVARYQTAQVHIAVAAEKLGRADEARMAATKAVQAERIAANYAKLSLDAGVRASFETLARTVVSPELIASLPAFTTPAPAPRVMPPVTAPVVVAEKKAEPRLEAPKPVVVEKKAEPARIEAPKAVVAEKKPEPARVESPKPAIAEKSVAVEQPVVVEKKAAAAPVEPPKVALAQPKPVVTSTITPAQPTPAPVTVAPVTVQPKPAAAQPNAAFAAAQPPTAQPHAAATQPNAALAQPKPHAAQSPMVAASRHAPSQSAVVGDNSRFAEAERLLNEGKLLAARQAFLRLAQTANVPRTDLLRVARGLNQTSAWRESSQLYTRLAPFQRGEELHMFYEAVNRYELGELNAARELLVRALPSLPNDREVALYRPRIEGTR